MSHDFSFIPKLQITNFSQSLFLNCICLSMSISHPQLKLSLTQLSPSLYWGQSPPKWARTVEIKISAKMSKITISRNFLFEIYYRIDFVGPPRLNRDRESALVFFLLDNNGKTRICRLVLGSFNVRLRRKRK